VPPNFITTHSRSCCDASLLASDGAFIFVSLDIRSFVAVEVGANKKPTCQLLLAVGLLLSR
jgi:hypothetical protein